MPGVASGTIQADYLVGNCYPIKRQLSTSNEMDL